MASFLVSLMICIIGLYVKQTHSISWYNAGYELIISRAGAAIGSVNNIIYMFGGSGGGSGSIFSSITRIDLSQTNPNWELSNLTVTQNSLVCAHQCSTIINNRYMYILDIYNQYYLIFDFNTQSFVSHNIPLLPSGGSYGCIVSDNSNELIYHISSIINVYNISSNSWSLQYASPPVSISRQSCIYYPNTNSIFVFPRSDPVMVYNIMTDTWTIPNANAKMTKEKFNTQGRLGIDGMMYIIGGAVIGSSTPTGDVDVYNPITGTMTADTPLITCKGPLQAIAIDDRIYVFGGYDTSYTYLTASEHSNILTTAPTANPTAPTAPTKPPTLSPTIASPIKLISWTDAGYTLPAKISGAAIAEFFNDTIYLFGGSGGSTGSSFSNVWKLNLSDSSPTWTALSGVTVSGLVCGHQCSTKIDNRYVYIFDVYDNYYLKFDAMIEDFISPNNIAISGTDDYGCIVTDDSNQYIYKIGAYVTVYNITQNRWTQIATTPVSLQRPSCAYYPGSHSIFVFPGDSPVLEYDIATNVWIVPNQNAQLTQNKFNTQSVLGNDGIIYIIAGSVIGVSLPTKDVDAFNPITKELTAATPLNSLSGPVNTVTVNENIYVFGGYFKYYDNDGLHSGYLNGSEVSNPLHPPTNAPTLEPTIEPTQEPTQEPTTRSPTDPTASTTGATDTTDSTTEIPSTTPTTKPTSSPTTEPTTEPTTDPSTSPTSDPTSNPTKYPTEDPTEYPTQDPVEVADNAISLLNHYGHFIMLCLFMWLRV